MQYTVRAFVTGRDERLDEVARGFCSAERSAYNLLREGKSASEAKAVIRVRHKITNARWVQSAINQARSVLASQEEGIAYRVEMCEQKIKNTNEKIARLSNPLKIEGCQRKVKKLRGRANELRRQLLERSYSNAVFGSRKLLRRLSIASDPQRRNELRAEWRERRSNHFFSVGQANQRGNGNSRLAYDSSTGAFKLEVRNWHGGDFSLPLRVPEHWREALKSVIERAESVRFGSHGERLDGSKGLAYSVRIVRSPGGYQALTSFELEVPLVEWNGRVAGIDINPEGIGCTITSGDGNLVASRFFGEERFITASANKRKWVLENTVSRMLRWCWDTYQCNAVAVEKLEFAGAYDFGRRINFKLSNFMKKKMVQRIKLSALKKGMLSVEVDSAYSSKVAVAKYGRSFGGFNRHQLAAFVIARRALGYGEAPVLDFLPKDREEKWMWNRSIRHYGHQSRIQTLLRCEPMEWKSGGDVNGGGAMTELLTAPPAITPSQMRLSHSPLQGVTATEIANRRTGRVRPSGNTSRGDGARGHRVDPPHPMMDVSPPPVYMEQCGRNSGTQRATTGDLDWPERLG